MGSRREDIKDKPTGEARGLEPAASVDGASTHRRPHSARPAPLPSKGPTLTFPTTSDRVRTLTFPNPPTDPRSELPRDLTELISNADTLPPPALPPTVPPPALHEEPPALSRIAALAARPLPGPAPLPKGLVPNAHDRVTAPDLTAAAVEAEAIVAGPSSRVPRIAPLEPRDQVVRWTTPNRRPLAPRAVERAARTSERNLGRHDEAQAPPPGEVVMELSDSDLIDDPSSPVLVPRDRSTVPVVKSAPSSVLELSESDVELDSEPELPIALTRPRDQSSSPIELAQADIIEVFPTAKHDSEPPLPNRLFKTPLPLPAHEARPAFRTDPVHVAPTPTPVPVEGARVVPSPSPSPISSVSAEPSSQAVVDAPPSAKKPLELRVPRPTPRKKPASAAEVERELYAFLGTPPPPPEETDSEEPLLLLVPSRPPQRTSARVKAASSPSPDEVMATSISPLRVASSIPPPITISAVPAATRAASPISVLRQRRVIVPLVLSHLAIAAAAIIMMGRRAPSPMHREPHVAAAERSPLIAGAGVPPMPPPPTGGCATRGGSRVLAGAAQIGPGLDVTVLETGFGVGLASKTKEAVGLRVDGSGLRVVETARIKADGVVNHVVVDQDREPEDEVGSLDVRIDSDEARTVLVGEGSPYKVIARGGAVLAELEPSGASKFGKTKRLWSLPAPIRVGTTRMTVAARGAPRVVSVPVYANEVLRAAGREDGSLVVALRRPSMLWLGATDASLAPAGPLLQLARKPGTTVGTPSVAAWGGGGVVAWAERAHGERQWNIVVASFVPDGEGSLHIGETRVIGEGMSPSIAALPDGDLLLAYADGHAGAHRVIARRLGINLLARGEPLTVSPETANAGQPVAAVRPDGRALIAYFAVSGARAAHAAAVHAAPLACDPGI